MKKAGLLIIGAIVAVILAAQTQPVDARPQYKKEHDEKYKESGIAEALADVKCNVCHFGTSKKNRTDYGKSLVKVGLTQEKFDELKTDVEALTKHIRECLDKVLKEKNDAGQVYGDLIKTGKLPCTEPKE